MIQSCLEASELNLCPRSIFQFKESYLWDISWFLMVVKPHLSKGISYPSQPLMWARGEKYLAYNSSSMHCLFTKSLISSMHDRSINNYTICPFSHVVPFLQSFSTWALDTHPCAKTPSSAPGKLTSDAFNISIWMQNLGILIRFKGAIPMVGIHTWNCSTGLIAKHCHPHLDYRSPSWIFNGRQMISPTSKPARDAINGWLKAGRFQQRPTLRL